MLFLTSGFLINILPLSQKTKSFAGLKRWHTSLWISRHTPKGLLSIAIFEKRITLIPDLPALLFFL